MKEQMQNDDDFKKSPDPLTSDGSHGSGDHSAVQVYASRRLPLIIKPLIRLIGAYLSETPARITSAAQPTGLLGSDQLPRIRTFETRCAVKAGFS